jgi:hypothetical protein
VAVELRRNAESLIDFVHPEHALYVFGPEDGSLGRATLAQCHRFLVIPTRHCARRVHGALRPARQAGSGRPGTASLDGGRL